METYPNKAYNQDDATRFIYLNRPRPRKLQFEWGEEPEDGKVAFDTIRRG